MSSTSPLTSEQKATAQSVTSLVILLHLLIVGLSLVCSLRSSILEQQLGRILGIYSRSLYFAPDRDAFLYTYGNTLFGDTTDDDHVIEIDIPADSAGSRPALTVEFPSPGSNWSLDRRRRFRLTHQLGRFAERDADDACGAIAREIAWQEMVRYDVDDVELRCYRRMTQPLMLEDIPSGYPPEDPTAAAYDRVIYTAQIFYRDDLQVAKKSAVREVAPRTEEGGGK